MISMKLFLFYSFKYLFYWLIFTPLDFPSAEMQSDFLSEVTTHETPRNVFIFYFNKHFC